MPLPNTRKTRGATKPKNVKLRPNPNVNASTSASSLKRPEPDNQSEEEEDDEDENNVINSADDGFGMVKPFQGFKFCWTGVEEEDKEELKSKILQLGGEFDTALMIDTSHLICGQAGYGTDKFKIAAKNNMKIRKASWVLEAYDSWIQGQEVQVSPSNETFTAPHHIFAPFSRCIICLTGFSSSISQSLIPRITNLGKGTHSASADSNMTHLVVSRPKDLLSFKSWMKENGGKKFEYVRKLKEKGKEKEKVWCVWEEWIWNSLEIGVKVNEEEWEVNEKSIQELEKDLVKKERELNAGDDMRETKKRKLLDNTGRGKREKDESLFDSTIIDLPPIAQSTQIAAETSTSLKPSKPSNLTQTVSFNLSLLKDDPTDLKPAIINKNSSSQKFVLENLKKIITSQGDKDEDEKMVVDEEAKQEETQIEMAKNQKGGFLSRLSRTKSEKIMVMGKDAKSGKSEDVKKLEAVVEEERAEPSRDLFRGLTFSYRGIKERHVKILKSQVLELGGKIVDDPEAEGVDKIVVPFFKILSADEKDFLSEDDKIITEAWIEHCVWHDKVLDPRKELFSKPIKGKLDGDIATELFIEASGYSEIDKELIERLMKFTGGHVTRKWKELTHIICEDPTFTKPKVIKAKAHGKGVMSVGELVKYLLDSMRERRVNKQLEENEVPDKSESNGTNGEISNDKLQIEMKRGPILEGCVIALSKKCNYLRPEFTALCEQSGAKLTFEYCNAVTHYIHDSAKPQENFQTFRLARSENKFIVHPNWMRKSIEKNERLDEALFPHTYKPGMALVLSSPGKKSVEKMKNENGLTNSIETGGAVLEKKESTTSGNGRNARSKTTSFKLTEDYELQDTPPPQDPVLPASSINSVLGQVATVDSSSSKPPSPSLHDHKVSTDDKSSSSKPSSIHNASSNQIQMTKEISNQIMDLLQTDFSEPGLPNKEKRRRPLGRKSSSTTPFSTLSESSSNTRMDPVRLPNFEMTQSIEDQSIVEAKPLTIKYEDKQSKAEKQKILKAFNRARSNEEIF